MMHGLGAGSKQSRFGWGCYPIAVVTMLPLHMLESFSQQLCVREGETSRVDCRVGKPDRQ